MNVSYTEPLRNAWQRMVRVLFRPFRIETWMVIGFAAFLSELTSGAGGHFSFSDKDAGHWGSGAVDKGLEILRGPVWLAVISGVAVAVLVLMFVLIWVSSRGKFIFLDDLVHERAEIRAPWSKFKRLGNSLFGWWLVYAFVSLVLFLAGTFPLWPMIADAVHGADVDFRVVGSWVLFGLIEGPLLFLILAVNMLANHFVVPIMYRNDLGATAAWSRMLGLLGRHLGPFILYAIILFVLWTLVFTAVLAIGLGTCCCGFLILGFPYIGTVFLLPVYVLFRGFGPEFLAQFGPEYAIFAPPAPPPPPPAAPAPPATTGAG